MKRGTVCPHLHVEGPRIAQVEKMVMLSSTLAREADMFVFVLLGFLAFRTPKNHCNDENFLGFRHAREEHNASFVSIRSAGPLPNHVIVSCNMALCDRCG